LIQKHNLTIAMQAYVLLLALALIIMVWYMSATGYYKHTQILQKNHCYFAI